MTYLYLAEPIDQTKRRVPLAEQLSSRLLNERISHYSPRAAWNLYGYGNFPAILQPSNNLVLGSARGVVAVIPRGVPTVGTPMEVQRALDLDIPACVLTDVPTGSLLTLPDVFVTSSVSEAVAWCWNLLSDSDVNAALPGFDDRRVPSGGETMMAMWTPSPDFPDGVPPRSGHPGDAGYDLTAAETVEVRPGEQGQVPCGVRVQLPPGWWSLIQGRSSSWRRGLDVKPSIIDWGYRGDLWVDCFNLTDEVVTVEKGERIAQLIPLPLAPVVGWHQVEQLDESARGADGYGSTGR